MSRAPRHHGQAFGLTLDVGFPCAGLPVVTPGPGTAPGRTVKLDLVPAAQLLDGFPSGTPRLWEVRGADGGVRGCLDGDPTAGFWLRAEGYGEFRIAGDGGRIGCAPVPGPHWRWQRYLVGQVLPFVAVLQGLEVFHASLVADGGAGMAFLGPSRSGKSSVAAALALRGRRFLADDVVAIDAESAGANPAPRAHAGFGLTSLRHDVARGFGRDALARLGPIVGSDDEAIRIAVTVDPAPVRISSLYFLERDGGRGGAGIERLEPLDPRLLLASGYNFTLRSPERLTRHLDVCSRLAGTAAAFRIRMPIGARFEDIAAAVDIHRRSVAA